MPGSILQIYKKLLWEKQNQIPKHKIKSSNKLNQISSSSMEKTKHLKSQYSLKRSNNQKFIKLIDAYPKYLNLSDRKPSNQTFKTI